MVRKLRDDNLRRGIVADKNAAEDALPYEAAGILDDGDSVRDYRDGQDDGLKEYRESHGPRGVHMALGEESIDYPAFYRCVEEDIEFFDAPADPRKAPMACPVCGADGTRDDVDTCTDAHGDEDDAQDTRDASGDDRQQTTLNAFNGDGS